MSHVMVAPELLKTAAADLATIGSTLDAAHLAASSPTLAIPPAAADEVSASIAQLFSDYGQEYQQLAGQAAVFHDRFAQRLTASANSYASAEAANAKLLQPLAADAVQDQLFNSVTTFLGPFNDTAFMFALIPVVFLFLLAILIIWAMAGPDGPMLYPL
jgi:PE family